MESIGNIANRHLHQKGVRSQIQEHMVVDFANQLMVDFWGDRIRDKARALYLRNNILTIAILDNRLMEGWKQREHEFIEDINRRFLKNLVSQIRYLA